MVLIVQRDYLQHVGLKSEMTRYIQLVKQRYDVELIPYPLHASISPIALRKGLRTLHSKRSIEGAFFVGQFQFPIFHNQCGDENTMFAFYSDLDGKIEDRDGDGKYDYYDPWNEGHSPEETHEIWVAVLRPYFHSEVDLRSPDEIQAYFRKVNHHLTQFERSNSNRAAILTSKDWPRLEHLHRSLEPIYGKQITQRGGLDQSGKAIPTNPDDLRFILAQQAEICFLYIHSGSSQHVMDQPKFPGNCVLPGVLDYPGRILLESLVVKPRVLSIWGCHALDIQNVKYKDNRFLADSYLFTPHFATQTLLGSSRSIGLEQVEFLIPNCKGECLATAWLDYLNHCYSEPFLREWLGVRRVWEQERYGFDWGFCIYGNPFDSLGLQTPIVPTQTRSSADQR